MPISGLTKHGHHIWGIIWNHILTLTRESIAEDDQTRNLPKPHMFDKTFQTVDQRGQQTINKDAKTSGVYVQNI